MSKHIETALNIIYGYNCNYRCQGCCNGSDRVQSEDYDPPLDEILDSIPKLAKYFSVDIERGAVTLLGGEAFLYWDKIVPIVKQVREHFPQNRVNIFTNGHLIYKHLDQLVDLMKNVGNCSVTITKHLTGMWDTKLGERWLANLQKIIDHPNIVKIHDEHLHIKDHTDCNIYLADGERWFIWYKDTPDGIKPYATGNPELSEKNGCAAGIFCSALFGSKFYKCSSLATLPGLLKSQGQYDDPDWAKYVKDYPYIDLNNFDQETYEYYKNTYGLPIPQCDMCNDDPNNVMSWKDRKYEYIFKNIKVVTG